MLPTIWRNVGSLAAPSFDDFIDRFFNDRPGFYRNSDVKWAPRTDVHETEKEILVDVELPGIDKKDVKVELKENVLTISGERKYENKSKDGKNRLIERHYGEFTRSFTLPDTVENDKISAAYKNGILTLTLPKAEKALPKEINVEVK